MKRTWNRNDNITHTYNSPVAKAAPKKKANLLLDFFLMVLIACNVFLGFELLRLDNAYKTAVAIKADHYKPNEKDVLDPDEVITMEHPVPEYGTFKNGQIYMITYNDEGRPIVTYLDETYGQPYKEAVIHITHADETVPEFGTELGSTYNVLVTFDDSEVDPEVCEYYRINFDDTVNDLQAKVFMEEFEKEPEIIREALRDYGISYYISSGIAATGSNGVSGTYHSEDQYIGLDALAGNYRESIHHEIAHALDCLIAVNEERQVVLSQDGTMYYRLVSENPEFWEIFEAESETSGMRDYAKTSYKEYFADAYEVIRDGTYAVYNMPRTIEYVKRNVNNYFGEGTL